jgi:hypothetical protein
MGVCQICCSVSGYVVGVCKYVVVLVDVLRWICLALYCYDFLENIGFVYPTMYIIVIGPSLLY